MLDFIGDFFRYLVKLFHHTRCKSNCGDSGCDCDNMAESSSSGSSINRDGQDNYLTLSNCINPLISRVL